MRKKMKQFTIALVGLITLFAISCIKPAHEEEFGPLPSKSCTDGILNQGEYFVDCGGPCAPCPVSTFINFKLDSTPWVHPDTNEIPVTSALDSVLFLDSTRIRLFMIDAAIPNNALTFVIDGTWRGVQELDQSEISGNVTHSAIGGTVALTSGVITITNVDEVNNLISGQFKFTTEEGPDGRIWTIQDGEFRDQPTAPSM